MEITLTKEQEAAIIREYGSTDYLQTYCNSLANYLLEKQGGDDRVNKIKSLVDLDDVTLDAMYAQVKAEDPKTGGIRC